jgi:hypothetical protein
LSSPYVAAQPEIEFSASEVPPWGYFRSEGSAAGFLIEFTKDLDRVSGLSFSGQVAPYIPRNEKW